MSGTKQVCIVLLPRYIMAASEDNAVMLYIVQEMYACTHAKINIFEVYSMIFDTNTNYQQNCRLEVSN
jgi:hypothetical protein